MKDLSDFFFLGCSHYTKGFFLQIKLSFQVLSAFATMLFKFHATKGGRGVWRGAESAHGILEQTHIVQLEPKLNPKTGLHHHISHGCFLSFYHISHRGSTTNFY